MKIEQSQLLLEKCLHHFPVHPEAEPALCLAQVDSTGSLVKLDARGVPVEALEGKNDANMIANSMNANILLNINANMQMLRRFQSIG